MSAEKLRQITEKQNERMRLYTISSAKEQVAYAWEELQDVAHLGHINVNLLEIDVPYEEHFDLFWETISEEINVPLKYTGGRLYFVWDKEEPTSFSEEMSKIWSLVVKALVITFVILLLMGVCLL